MLISKILEVFTINPFYKFTLKADMQLYIDDLIKISLIIVSAILTFYLNIDLGFGPIIASALIGIIAVFIIPKYQVEVFCGSFVGMASNLIFTNYIHFLEAAIISAFIYILLENNFKGIGGKLGAVAFVGSLMIGLLTNVEFSSGNIPSMELSILLIIYSGITAVLTFLLSIRYGYSSVLSSSVVALLAVFLLPILHGSYGEQLALMAFCATFVGMSSEEILDNEFLVMITAIFAALIFIITTPYLGGLGGKLGMTAFLSVLFSRKSLVFIEYMQNGQFEEIYKLAREKN